MSRLLLLPLLLAAGWCPVPTPTPSPEPTAPAPVCQEGQTCGCWHMPPGQGWQQLPPCTTPTPPPASGCVLAGEPSVSSPQPGTLGAQVNQAMKNLRPDCEVGGTCLLGDMTQQEWQAKVEAELRRMGLCAGQHAPSTDELAVAVLGTDPWQGYHVFAGNDGSGPVPPGGARRTVKWAPQAFTGSWMPPSVTPTPTPPPVVGCSDPVTPKVDRWNLTPHNRWVDATPLFYNRETTRWDGTMITGYCDAAKFVNRLHCPARSECPGYKCEERSSCEALGVGGKPLWRCAVGQPDVNPANPFQASCGGAWIEACAVDGTGCTRLAQ